MCVVTRDSPLNFYNLVLIKKVELQAVTSTKTAVTLSTVTATMELLALVAVSVFATLDVGIRFSYFKGNIPPTGQWYAPKIVPNWS